MSEPIYSPICFVGRADEIAQFERILDVPENPEWVLNVYGHGGIGKTQLLYRFAEITRQRREIGARLLVTGELIDFFWTAHQHELEILKSLADQLAPEQFGPFYTAFSRYKQLLAEDTFPAPEQVNDQVDEVRGRFLEGYGNLVADRIVLLFDTAEVVGEGALRFLGKTLPDLKRVRSQTLVIIAGRQSLAGLLPLGSVKPLPIKGFSSQEVSNYLAEQGIHVSSDVAESIATLSCGRPVLVALVVDWINWGYSPAELLTCQSDEFEHAMIERVRQLRFPVDEAILAMAHFSRRFDEHILAYVLDEPLDTATSLIKTLAQFSFVKLPRFIWWPRKQLSAA